MEVIKTKRYQSPAGKLVVGSYDGRLCLCDWTTAKYENNINRLQRYFKATCEEGNSAIIEKAIAELDEYFAGERRTFNIPIVFAGTEFQCNVWNELMNIPFGKTISYAELARRIGNPKAVRAVASANANNPISIFVPCHRVIGSDNKLTGYGGGLDAKRILLELESAVPENDNYLSPNLSL